MAYDEELAVRVRRQVAEQPGITEKRMFGGSAFLLDGHLACSVTGDGLMVRVDPEAAAVALAEPDVRPLSMGGRPMTGWVLVGSAAVAADEDLRRWVRRGTDVAGSLPGK